MFSGLYAREGRPSVPPEQLLRASLLQMLYSIRSERQVMERLEFDPLFRWFVGLGPRRVCPTVCVTDAVGDMLSGFSG